LVAYHSYPTKDLARILHELLSRDHEDGRATRSTIAECGMRIENLLKSS
jgi:hypothetical protein